MPDPSATEPPSHGYHAIETVEEITGASRHQIAVYCRYGIISPVGDPDEDGWLFDDRAILMLRRIENLRVRYEMNLSGLQAMARLLQDVERLSDEVRFLRGR